MADSTFFWGAAKTSWERVNPKIKKRIDKKTTAIARKIINRTGKVKPGIKTKAFFRIMALMQKNGFNPVDVEYWNKKGWLDKKRPWK